MVLGLLPGTAVFRDLGQYNVRLRRTKEGGWGVRLTDFAQAGFVEVPPEHHETVVSSEVLVYEALEETKVEIEPTTHLPLHEVPRKGTAAGKGKTIRTQQEQVLEAEEGVWVAVRGERRGRWPKDRFVDGARRRLRPRQKFMKELCCGSLMMTWMAAALFQLPVSQPDDLMDGYDCLKTGNKEEIMRQLHRDDPWLTVIAWPCGGQLGAFPAWPRRSWPLYKRTRSRVHPGQLWPR